MSLADELAKLAALRDSGVLSEREFEQQKAILLGRSDAATPARRFMGEYELLEVVGEGGMGRVYRARNHHGKDVAIKVLHHHLASKPGFVERFRQEAEALAALDHPNIVKVHEGLEEAGQLGLVMEWVPGRPLSHLIGRETGPIPWDRARLLVGPLLDAVEHAHGRGVVHRDLKPDNIRVTPQGTIKILDFGIARVGDTRGRTKTGTGMGTVDYMAPEQYTDAKAVDGRADIYALGMTLYEMVAGRLPWDPGDTEFSVLERKHRGDMPPPTQFYPAIPDWVVAGIRAALHPDPGRRPPTVADLRRALTSGAHPQAPGVVRSGAIADPTVPASDLAASMDPLWILFGVRGRIGRSQLFWGAMLYLAWTFGVVAAADAADLGPELTLPVVAALLWPSAALSAKRTQDVGISGWIGAGVVVVGALLTEIDPEGLVGLGLLVYVLALFVVPGTNGPNAYGVHRCRPPSEAG